MLIIQNPQKKSIEKYDLDIFMTKLMIPPKLLAEELAKPPSLEKSITISNIILDRSPSFDYTISAVKKINSKSSESNMNQRLSIVYRLKTPLDN
jgi:hypothetical protein